MRLVKQELEREAHLETVSKGGREAHLETVSKGGREAHLETVFCPLAMRMPVKGVLPSGYENVPVKGVLPPGYENVPVKGVLPLGYEKCACERCSAPWL
ncbi:hypothetical protein ACOMHN_028662 [Nucella lapillus]